MGAEKKTVMVADGDIRKTLAVVRGIGDEYRTIVVHSNRLPVAGLSKFCNRKIKIDYGNGFTESIVELIKKERPEFLICTQEETLIRLNEIRETLELTGVKLTFPPKEILNGALDKSVTLDHAKRLGIPLPKTIVRDSLDQLSDVEKEIGYPVVVKPKRSIFLKEGRIIKTAGPSYASNREELDAIIETSDLQVGDFLFQEYIKGKGIGGFFLSDDEGEVVMSFAHKRLLDVNPTGSGSCLRSSDSLNKNVRELSEKLLKGMNWSGVSMVEFRMDKNGTCYLMEVNGRFWGSLALGVECGANFPLVLVKMLDKVELNFENQRRRPLTLVWELGMILRFLRVLRGRPKGYPGEYPTRFEGLKEVMQLFSFGNKYEVLKWNDPMPFLGELAGGLSKL